jgi:uncharacterized protein YndB with AHSA1/START domain
MSRAQAQSDPACDYGRALVVAASPEQVFDAIATLGGLKRWWTPRASGSDRPGEPSGSSSKGWTNISSYA